MCGFEGVAKFMTPLSVSPPRAQSVHITSGHRRSNQYKRNLNCFGVDDPLPPPAESESGGLLADTGQAHIRQTEFLKSAIGNTRLIARKLKEALHGLHPSKQSIPCIPCDGRNGRKEGNR